MIKYFADLADGSTLEFGRVDYISAKEVAGFDPISRKWVLCNRKVEYKTNNPTRHVCDDRCMNATGRSMKCECRCGGKNHGKGNGFKAEAA